MKTHTRLSVEALESRDVPANPDLMVSEVTLIDPTQFPAVPGDRVGIRYTISNVGDAVAKGNTLTHFYFTSSSNPIFPAQGPIIEEPRPLDLAPGTSVTLTKMVPVGVLDLGAGLPQYPAGTYYIDVQADGGGAIDPNTLQNPNIHDNNWALSPSFNYVFQFGKVGTRPNVTLNVQAGGNIGFGLTNGGTGEIQVAGVNSFDLNVNGTNKGSVASAVAKGGAFLGLRNITAGSVLQALNMPTISANGNIAFSGGLGALTMSVVGLGPSTGDLTIASGFGAGAKIDILNGIYNTRISALDGIDSLQTGEWLNTGSNADLIAAPFIGDLTTSTKSHHSGNFQAALQITGPADAKGFGLEKALIAGSVSRTWTIGQGSPLSVGSVTIAGAAQDWQLLATGAVNGLTVKGNFHNTDTTATAVALSASSYGKLEVDGDLSVGAIEAMGTQPGEAIAQLKLDSVTALAKLKSDQGGINALTAAKWPAATSIETAWIGSIVVDEGFKDFTPASVRLTGVRPGTDVSVGMVNVNTLSGSWKVFADVESIAAIGISSFSFVGGDVNDMPGSPGTYLGKLVVQQNNADVQIRTTGIGKVGVGSELTGSIQVTSPVPIAVIYGKNIAGLTVDTLGDIGKIGAGIDGWSGGTVTARSVGKFNSKGDLSGVTFNLSGSAASIPSIGSFTVNGAMTNTTLNLSNGASKIAVGSITSSTISTPAGNIASFVVDGVKGATGPLFSSTKIDALIIGLLSLRDVDESTSAAAYGVTATTVFLYHRTAKGKTASILHNLTTPGTYDPVGKYSLTIT